MPVFESGMCQFCGRDSDLLLPKVGIERKTGRIVCGYACPSCRRYLEHDSKEREHNEQNKQH